ncbi:MAG: tRNA pseudouridine(38-40) synthase TruA [Desulfobacterales bacterium]|nr:tRNA pseudouridine(38-40) synthase TruA [Desulfobacterales bacterium]
MIRNFKLIIEYDGCAYHGWQRQKTDRSIQGEIEKAASKMTNQPITITASGRTDAGVHAFGQTANFKCDTKITPEGFRSGLNCLLDDDIVICACDEVDDDFHARFNVKSKIYRYNILNRQLPEAINRQYQWHVRKKLDLESMRAAIKHIIGPHDFKAFENTGSPRPHTTRTIFNASLIEHKHGKIIFEIEADGFLRFMVRNITGTLVDVGLGKITPKRFNEILLSLDRDQASATAPPQGLFLVEVKY